MTIAIVTVLAFGVISLLWQLLMARSGAKFQKALLDRLWSTEDRTVTQLINIRRLLEDQEDRRIMRDAREARIRLEAREGTEAAPTSSVAPGSTPSQRP